VSTSRPWLSLYPPWVPATLAAPDRSVLDLFEGQARARPDRPAFHYFDSTLTYAEVDRAADSLADALQDLDVAPGDRVALYLQNVPQFAMAQYAAWKAGGIVVPLNPMFREAELRTHLQDAGATVLVCLESLYAGTARAALPGTPVRHVVTTSELDWLAPGAPRPGVLAGARRLPCDGTLDLAALAARPPAGRRRPRPGPGDVAYLTYTSGTTGPPKGAMNTHANVVHQAQLYATWMRLGPGDVVLGVAPLFHITGMVAHLAAAAAAGAPVVLFYRFEAGEALRLVERWGATFTIGSITVFIAMADHPDVRARRLGTLRAVYSGGAPVAPAIIERFRERTGPYIHNVYGLTETTSPSHAVPLGRQAPVDPATGALSIGIPVPGAEARIVDLDTGETELEPGEPGEIVIRGPMVVAGYWGRPEETAHAIRGGWLHTGDVGTRDADGWFYLVDRKKDLINAAGYKVWPREVEDVLCGHPAVKEAAVVGVPDDYRGETVKAFVAIRRDAAEPVTPGELVEFCRARLAVYKCPRQVEIVAEIPKTPSGKLLRRLLRSDRPAPA
jgi:long-chain acyl-CoA synthetase